MKLVIDIPEEKYTEIKARNESITELIEFAIYMGKPFDKVLSKIKEEIIESKTRHEDIVADRDMGTKVLVSNMHWNFLNIIDKYIADKEQE